ncbi:MAG: hypothetical protein AAF236_02050 [Verrucomicrobiota bacterium]
MKTIQPTTSPLETKADPQQTAGSREPLTHFDVTGISNLVCHETACFVATNEFDLTWHPQIGAES